MQSTPASKKMSPLALVLIVSAIFFVLFLAVSGAMYVRGSKTLSKARTGSASLFDAGSVGVVEMNGVIMDSKKTLGRLEKFEDDDGIKAVVLRLNSPGGAVAPSQEIYEAVKNYKKPIVVSMSSVAASGAFYIACAAKKVYANPGTITGSIGVIMEFVNLGKLYDWAKVQRYAIKTGKYKDAGAEYRDMTPDERALLQGMIDDVLLQFKTAVAKGRNLSMEQVTAIADGRIFSGNQAKNLHLVDELGTFQDAVNEAAKMAKLKGKPQLVYPEKSSGKLLDLILGDNTKDEDSRTALAPLDSTSIVKLVRAFAHETGDEALASPGVYWLWNGAH